MPRVLIVDQFHGPSPFEMTQEPVDFEQLVKDVLASEAKERADLEARGKGYAGWPWAYVTEVPDTYIPRTCTTVIRADDEGYAYVWRQNWDSSG